MEKVLGQAAIDALFASALAGGDQNATLASPDLGIET